MTILRASNLTHATENTHTTSTSPLMVTENEKWSSFGVNFRSTNVSISVRPFSDISVLYVSDIRLNVLVVLKHYLSCCYSYSSPHIHKYVD